MRRGPASSVLPRIARLLEDRVVELEQRVRDGDASGWPDLLSTVTALVTVLDALQVAPPLLSTEEKAEALGISVKTLLRRKAAGEVRPVLDSGGRRGRAIRWAGGPK